MIVALILIILILLYLFMIKPNTSRKDAMKPYEKVFIAHRGLFNNVDVPENSLLVLKKQLKETME